MNKMELGHWKDRARPRLVYFVFGCIIVITGLLHISQISVERGETITSIVKYSDYLN